MSADMVWEGVPEWQKALDALITQADVAGEQIVTKGAHLVEAAAKQKASGRPGPNVVTGTLRRSIGLVDVTRLGPGRWQSQTAPTVVYARRIELGFHSADSLGRVYDQPPFPYLGPGLDDAITALGALYREMWAAALNV